MPATLTTAPPSRALSDNPLWITIQTALEVSPKAKIILTLSSTGPVNNDTITFAWGSTELVFTFKTTPNSSGLQLPVIGVLSLAFYTDTLAEALAQNEILHSYFSLDRSTSGANERITLTQRSLEVVDITVTDAATNLTAAVTDVSVITAQDNLRALVEVWTDTGDLLTDVKLISLHAPYVLPAGTTDIDISAAFATLKPHLPASNSINPIFNFAWITAEATDAYTPYYLRYCDKFGAPAVAQSLIRSANSYIAMVGALSADSTSLATTPLRHAYKRRDGATFWKPTTVYMPDYMYWVCPSGVDEVYPYITLYWSDGTTSVYLPYDTDSTYVFEDHLYWFASGYAQLKIGTVSPSGGTATDAYVVGYRCAIARVDGTPMLGTHSVYYTLLHEVSWDVPYLLFSNGMGGCESAAFRGKWSEVYRTIGEEFQRPRDADWTVALGEYISLGARGRREWQFNTGWYPEPYYLEHLRQLALAQEAWLIDVDNQKFLKVLVQPGDIQVNAADETLYSLTITVRAGWTDAQANI